MKKKQHFKEHPFWLRNSSNGTKKYIIKASELVIFLNKNNYYLFDRTIIKIKNNIAFEKTKEEVYLDCSSYVKTERNKDLNEDFMKQGEILLIRQKGVLLLLNKCKLKPLRDTKNESFIIFKNCIYSITKNDIKRLNKKEVKKLNGFIWSDSIIQHNVDITSEKSQMQKFIELVTNDNEHYLYAISIIGYLLHKYKDPSNAVAIILSDAKTEVLNVANGGSGKGIIMNAINKVVNVTFENGKNINLTSNKFFYQNIKFNTDILFLDDVKENFDFENLFSVITTNMMLEKKGKTPFEITFEFTPKIVITTNYTIINKGESSIRRKRILFLNNYFNLHHTPKQEFENLFFTEWKEDEWKRLYNFMMLCLQTFLKTGIGNYKNKKLELKKLISETSIEFVEFMKTKYLKEQYYKLDDLTKLFKPQGSKTMVKWIKYYANYNNLTYSNKIKNGLTYFALFSKK